MELPHELQDKISTFAKTGRLIDLPGDLFKESSWLAVMLGQGIKPQGYDPIAELCDTSVVKNIMIKMQHLIEAEAEAMPCQADFIAQYCAAPNSL